MLPDLGSVDFQGINGRTLLLGGLVVCALGLAFGMVIFFQLLGGGGRAEWQHADRSIAGGVAHQYSCFR